MMREQIMALKPDVGHSDAEWYQGYECGFTKAQAESADLAEAREKELLAERAQMIAELRAVVKCAEIVIDESGKSHYMGEAYPQDDIEAIINKYEVKK